MFEFGRDLKRWLNDKERGGLDAEVWELLDLSRLDAAAREAEIDAGRAAQTRPCAAWLGAAAMRREAARRSADIGQLEKACLAAVAASDAARSEAARTATRLERALIAMTAADLHGGVAMLDTARLQLEEAIKTPLPGEPRGLGARIESAWARLSARRALLTDQYDHALDASALLDKALHALSVPDARRDDRGGGEAFAARLERGELLADFALKRSDPALAISVCADLHRLTESIDAQYAPVSFCRAATALGSTLVVVGRVEGRGERLAEGVGWLCRAEEALPKGHSDVDRAATLRALGVGLHLLGESVGLEKAYDRAAAMLDLAQALAPGRRLQALVEVDRTACLARLCERRKDLAPLTAAEARLRRELVEEGRPDCPVRWAAIQLGLVRIYEARARLSGRASSAEACYYALATAEEVFAAAGLGDLGGRARTGLDRLSA